MIKSLNEKHFVRLWHFTYFDSALSIIKNNEFRLEVNDWPEDEGKENIDGKWYDNYGEETNIPPKYMLCTTRIKNSYSGYSSAFQKRFDNDNISFARIELDENALELNNNLIVRSEPDTRYDLHIDDFKDQIDWNRNWQFQHEERILAKVNTIKNALKYINRIDFLISDKTDKNILMQLLQEFSDFQNKVFIYNNVNNFNYNKQINESLQLNEIPIEAGLNDIPELYNGKVYNYKYFGDCKNTVDIDHIWDATQMSNIIQDCKIIPIKNIIKLLNNGDRKIPVKLLNAIDKLTKLNKLNDLSEICAGINEYQKIMFIYITELDTHFFFDCQNIILPTYLYHATPSCYLMSIKKFGLGAKFPRKRLWDYEETIYKNIKQGVFLANDEYVAYDYVDNSDAYEDICDNHEDDVDIIVFKIKTSDLDISKLQIDQNQDFDNIEDATYFYDGIIPYEKLEKMKLNECLTTKYINSLNENLKNQMNGLYKYQDWQEFQNDVNKIGWENFILYNYWKRNHAWKRKTTGHYVMNMKDPREEAIYYAWLVDGKPLAITNVYVYPEEIWIGDFEVSKFHKGEGLGKLLFNALKDEFPGIGFGLTYRDENAKKFWLKMGFKPTENGHVMVYEY